MKTKMTVLVDNVPSETLAGEWGLSILIEYGEKKILADAGSSGLFAENMKKLGFSVADVDYATLSHAHYDHANGMPYFFRENQKSRLYVRETTLDNCYYKYFFIRKYIGISENLLTDYADRIETVSGDYRLCEGAYLIPHKSNGLERIGKRERMYRRTEKGWMPDDFSHEQSLVLDTGPGLVIVNCCSHGGVANIISDVRQTFPEKHIYGIIGGFHLFNKTEREVRQAAADIAQTGIDYVCTGHCTKDKAYAILKQTLGGRLHQLRTGLVLEF